jgi:Pyruvate flavodoxin/ferredoxin oxidoreductase, thiamine diP-bdg
MSAARDLPPLPDLLHDTPFAGPVRTRRPVYVDLLPPCNNEVSLLSDANLRSLVSEDLVRAHRSRALSPDRPFIRGTAQNPDTYFQARETVNPFDARVPEAVQAAMDELGARATPATPQGSH